MVIQYENHSWLRGQVQNLFFLFSMIKTAKHLEKYTTNAGPFTTFNIWKWEHKRNIHIFPDIDKRTFIFISFLLHSIVLYVCTLCLRAAVFKHLRSSRSRWRAASWSCGWRRSSICQGSCAGQTGWSWRTGSGHISPPTPGQKENEVGWWETRGRTVPVGSGAGRDRSEGSRWIRTGWTWARGCESQRSMPAGDGDTGLNGVSRCFRHIFYHFADPNNGSPCCPRRLPCPRLRVIPEAAPQSSWADCSVSSAGPGWEKLLEMSHYLRRGGGRRGEASVYAWWF